ncbi:MAG: hypothetical protein ACLUTU_07550 [Blautia faecis]
MTRVQKERFFNEEDYVRLKDTYILKPREADSGTAGYAGFSILFHRVGCEIVSDVDQDPRAAYLDQCTKRKMISVWHFIMALPEIPDPLTGR